jgi:hypothetical protein
MNRRGPISSSAPFSGVSDRAAEVSPFDVGFQAGPLLHFRKHAAAEYSLLL